MKLIEDILLKNKIIPIVVINDISLALKLSEVFFSNGIKIIEITLRTENALKIISEITKNFPKIIVGAGTVLSSTMAIKARDYGASFSVSPGFTESLIDGCKKNDIPFLPGASSVSEIMKLRENNYKYIKFFPASSSGGIDFVKALESPFPDICFCPTGGINESNLYDWLSLNNVVSVGGTWISPESLIEEKNWNKIAKIACAAGKV